MIVGGFAVTREDGDGADGRPAVSRRTVAFVLGVFGIAAPQVATQPPHGWAAWVLLVAGAMAGGLFATGLLSSFLDAATLPSPLPTAEPPATGSRRPPPDPTGTRSWLRRLLLPIGVLAVAMAVGIGAAVSIGAIRGALRGCTTPVEVPVVSSPETFETATALARAFELTTARGRKDCPAASLSVYAAESTDVQRGLLDHWRVLDNGGPVPLDYLRDLGPRPQLWMPDSTVDVDRLSVTINRTGVGSPLGRPAVYSWSPLVLAVPEGSNPFATPRDWPTMLEAYTRAGFDVIRPDSSASIAGQLSLAATYPSSQSWTPPELKVARGLEALLTSGREHAGYPLGDSAALLRRYQSTSCDTVSKTALVLPEQFALRPGFAGWQVRADLGCSGSAGPRRLTAIYPPNTPILNHPVVPLSWESTADPAARTAAEFVRWLGTDAGHTAIETAGLHPGDRRSPEVRSPARVTPGLDPALVDVIDRVVAHQAEVARPVQLLLAIDTSGSMATRFDLAAAMLDGTAERLSDGDQLGLLTFGGAANGARLLVKPAPAGTAVVRSGSTSRAAAGGTTRDAVRAALARLRPNGGTPLRRALDLGVSTLLTTPTPAVPSTSGPTGESAGGSAGDGTAASTPIRALVVVTDGRDTAGGANPAIVADRAHRGGVRVYVVATGSIDCSLPALATVTARSGGDCLVAKDGPEASADALAAAIWGVSHA